MAKCHLLWLKFVIVYRNRLSNLNVTGIFHRAWFHGNLIKSVEAVSNASLFLHRYLQEKGHSNASGGTTLRGKEQRLLRM